MKKNLGAICRLTVGRVLCAAGMLMAFSAPSATMTLVASNAVWRYLVTPTDPGTTWRAREFNDLGWPSGPAQLGFGEGDEATILTGMSGMSNGIVTAYFRKSFVVANANAVTNLNLRLLRDDGAVVYLNGAEVRRDNLPTGDINHFTFTLSAVGGAEESTFFSTTIPPSSLVSGTNVVAVEVHQNNVLSSDLSFALELVAMTGATTNQPPVTNYPPVVRLVSPTNGATFTAPTNLLLAATAYDPGTNGRVLWLEFYKGTNRLGTVSNMYSGILGTNFFFEWMNAPTGTHLLTVKARDNQGAVSTSPPVTVSIRPASPNMLMGFLRWEVYTNVPGMVLSDLTTHPSFPDHPAFSSLLNQFETPEQVNDSFGARITGFVLPPVTGDYVFYIASDDQGALFLSSDETPANKVQIAWEPTWSPVRQWVGMGFGRTNNENISSPIPLQAGRRYYIEALHKEGGGGDHLGVAWQMPGELPPEVGAPPIAGAYLATLGGVPTNPLPTITIVASDSEAQEPYVDPVSGAVFAGDGAGFTLTRSGDLGPAVAVRLAFSGTASNGLDLAAIPNSIVMPAGVGSTWISFLPTEDNLVEGDETLVLTILPDAAYQTGWPRQAAVAIHDGVMTPTNNTRELHVVSFYSGTVSDGGPSHNHEQGQASVVVNRPGTRVTLFLSSYEPVLWNITAQAGTVIERIILGGYYPQAVAGVGPEVAVESACPGGNCYPVLWAGYAIESIEFYRAVPRLHALSGLEIASFHGGYQAPYPTPVMIDGVQNDARLRSDYPTPTPIHQLPALTFSLSFYPESFAANGPAVFHRDYTLAGPVEGGLLLPGLSVVADGGVSNYFGVQWQSVLKINPSSGLAETMALPPTLPELNRPMGVTFDSFRNRLLLASLGGEGLLYAYNSPQNRWSLVSSLNNLDFGSIAYEPNEDRLYGVEVSRGHEGRIRIVTMNSSGGVLGEIALPQMSFAAGVIGYRPELTAVGGYLVLLLEPRGFDNSAGSLNESRMYLINPRTSQVWLTYRNIQSPPVVVQPVVNIAAFDAEAAEFPSPYDFATFTLTRSGDTSRPISVQYSVSGSALSGVDYVNLGNSLNIAAGVTTASLVVIPFYDLLAEPTETVTISVVAPACAPSPSCYLVGPSNEATAFIRNFGVTNNGGPPVITRQPTNQIRSMGGTAVFSLIATGAPPLRYQWQFNGQTMTGATNSVLVISNVQPGQAGSYRAAVSNPGGSVTSVIATLTVLGPPSGPGSLDPSFSAEFVENSVVRALARQPDGRLLILGWLNGLSSRQGMARLHRDGSSDPSFSATFNNADLFSVVIQPDGRILVAGTFSEVNGIERYGVVRLHPDGSLDTTFQLGGPDNPWAATRSLVLQPDGKIIIGGLGEFGGRNVLKRLNPDGSVDESFNAGEVIIWEGDDYVVFNMALQPDGKILVQGDISQIQGHNVVGFFRLNSDGSLDQTFRPAWQTEAVTYGGVTSLLLQPDGRIMVGGWLNFPDGTMKPLVRLHPDGRLDASFAPAVEGLGGSYALARQFDGKIIVGGNYSGVPTVPPVRLNPDGSRDTTFNVGSGVQGDILRILIEPEGGILVGGQFTRYNGVRCNGLVRLFGNSGLPPAITRQPLNQIRSIGQTALFSLIATGASPLRYQWQFNNLSLPGATNSLLILSNVQPGQAGGYRAVVANSFGSVTSAVATLTVTVAGESSVVAWGDNLRGQTNVPPGLNQVISVAAGGSHSLALQANGSIVGWGAGTNCNPFFSPDVCFGQSIVPPFATNVATIGAGWYHSLGLRQDGTLFAWGAGTSPTGTSPHYGQSIVPPGLSNVAAIAAGGGHNLALKPDGSVVAWGYNNYGQASMPAGLTNVVAIAAGGYHNLALKSDGTVLGWGWNADGQISLPAALGDVTDIAAGFTHSLALRSDGTVVSWGDQTNVPSGLSNVVAIAAGTDYSLALKRDGTVVGWGFNQYGQSAPPAGLSNVVAISASSYHSLAATGFVPPRILTQPLNQTVAESGRAILKVASSGSLPLTYQWRFNGVSISGATNAVLRLSEVQSGSDGSYSVVVSNRFGSVTSATATLTVLAPTSNVPVIASFAPRSAPVGTTLVLTGANFGATAAMNTVFFGAVKATVVSASPTALTVTVPPGAGYAPISVTVNGRTAWSRQPFGITFPGTGRLDAASFVTADEDRATGDGPVHVVAADLDGDGKPDLAVADRFANTLSLYRNISVRGVLTPQSFGPRIVLATGLNPTHLIAADLDGDGRLDLVVANPDENIVTVLRNLGTSGDLSAASFAPRFGLVTGANPYCVAAGDIDGDGKTDLAVANYLGNSVSILRNLSSPGFLSPSSFAPKIDWATREGAHNVAVGDLDGDDKPEVVVACAGSSVASVFHNRATPNMLTPASFARFDFPAGGKTVAIGDLDGDGRSDLATGSWTGNSLSLLRNTGTGLGITSNSFAPAVVLQTGGYTHTLALGDLDGDGRPDLAAVTEMESQLLLYHNGATPGSLTASNFSPRADLGTGWNAVGVTLADFDLDGRLDVAFANHYDDTVRIYHNGTPTTNEQPTVVALLNVDCGANIRESEKHGFAAVGLTSSDFWNFYTRDADDSHNNWRTFGVLSNLLYANRAPSGVILTVSNAPGAWGLEVSDPMYRDYIYPSDGGNITLTVDRLPPGDYQFLLYGHGPADHANSVYELLVDGVSLGSRATVLGPGWDSPAWQDGVQYAAFRNVRIASSNQHVTVVVHPGADGYAVLAGLQIAATRFDQVVPMSFVERDLTSPLYLPGGSTYEVMLYAHPQPGVRVYAVEDHPPTGWAVSAISDGGMFDPATGKVKFGPFFDGIRRTLGYEVRPVPGATNAQCFTGVGSADGVDSPIMGARCMVEARPHPADAQDSRWGLSIAEVTAYASAWRRGETWPVAPNPIPMDFVTRAGTLWRAGEGYTVDATVTDAPLWWVSCYAPNGLAPANAPFVAGSSLMRRLPAVFAPAAALPVGIEVMPASIVGSYAIEEHLPPGWTALNISAGGEVDRAGSTVRWGPFFGSAPQSLAYEAVPPANAGAFAEFSGAASFDGVSQTTAGPAQTCASGRLIALNSATGCAGCLRVSGLPGQRFVIEASVDLQSWVPLSVVTIGDATTEFTDPSAGEFSQRFYRARPAP